MGLEDAHKRIDDQVYYNLNVSIYQVKMSYLGRLGKRSEFQFSNIMSIRNRSAKYLYHHYANTKKIQFKLTLKK
jgi:hypothetical protein